MGLLAQPGALLILTGAYSPPALCVSWDADEVTIWLGIQQEEALAICGDGSGHGDGPDARYAGTVYGPVAVKKLRATAMEQELPVLIERLGQVVSIRLYFATT